MSEAANGEREGRHRRGPSPWLALGEIIALCVVAGVTILVGWRLVGENNFARQLVVWVANVLMLLVIWAGLRLRGESWASLGLRRGPLRPRGVLRAIGLSGLVLVFALAGFVVGAVIMGPPDAPASADMGSYDYLRGNLAMLLLALPAVYFVSSFGEEVLYRGFLMNRITEFTGTGRGGWTVAVLVSALVFGVIHFAWGVVGMVQTGFMGLALAIAFLKVGRNLWILVLAHAYLDTVLLLQLYLAPPPA